LLSSKFAWRRKVRCGVSFLTTKRQPPCTRYTRRKF